MEKRIEDYLRLYWHCDAELKRNNSEHIHEGNVNDLLQSNNNHSIEYIKPIIRPLSDMTEEEKSKISKSTVNKVFYPEEFLYLLKQGFDLFGLIESDLAINKTTYGE